MECCRGRHTEAERQFDPAIASRDLDRYHRKGPDATSRLLLETLGDQPRRADSVLDIGSGVGVLDFELLASGVQTATLIDASPASLDAAAREAEARDLADRLQFVTGDFTANPHVSSADVVTMHRVVCCYPDYTSLLQACTRL
jgi:magnesium-protoporphyrin O-methyltransferase